MNQLINVERWIEQLVEEPFVKLFAGRLLPQDVARHLLRALEDGERFGADGRPEVPGRYRIELNAGSDQGGGAYGPKNPPDPSGAA